MTSNLCLTARFLQPYYHGRTDGDEPEWPPSPLRMFQALVAAAAARWRDAAFRQHAGSALDWLEQQAAPAIVAPVGQTAAEKYRLYVPDNTADLAAGTWVRGDTTKIVRRTEKDVRPTLLDGEAVHYLFPVGEDFPYFDTLRLVARSITHLGWGVDMVAGDATMIAEDDVARLSLSGERWNAIDGASDNGYRVPVEGTLDALMSKHSAFLRRISRDVKSNESFSPVPPISAFRVVGYRRANEPAERPHVVFELRNDDGTRYAHRQEQLVHIAGMVRHLAIELMKKHPPDDVPDDWVEKFVAGHRDKESQEHRQFSYLPLQSVGHAHTDPGVRRLMITAPLGYERHLRHLAKWLTGLKLRPTSESKIDPPSLVRVQHDTVASFYLKKSNAWASVSPVILPGHDDHKPDKTRRLIEKALCQSGIDQPCEFEWSAFSRFPKSLSAHKYDKQKREIGYIRPSHLCDLTAVHLQLRFKNEIKVPGPISIGSGRHCGLGLMVRTDED